MFDLTAVIRLEDQFSSPMKKVTDSFGKVGNLAKSLNTDMTGLGVAQKRTAANTSILTSGVAGLGQTVYSASTVSKSLADATSVLDNNANKLGQSSNSAGGGISKMTQNSSTALTSVRNLAVGIMGVVGAQKLLNSTLGQAAKMEMESVSIEALFKGNTKAAGDFFDYLNTSAKNSYFGQNDFMVAGKAFVPIMKSNEELEYAVKLTERLGASNPLEGMQGASFSIREALSGDIVSLAERFNLPKSALAGVKEATTMTGKLEALDKVLGDMGYTQEYMNSVNGTAYAKWQKLGETVSMAMQDIGMAALGKAKPAIDMLTKALDSQAFETFKDGAAGAFASLFSGLTAGLKTLYDNREQIASFGKSVATAMQAAGATIKSVASFITNNWGAVSNALIGATVAVGTFKTIMGGMAVVDKVTAAIKNFRTGAFAATFATKGLSAALLANPMVWIPATIAGVVAAGVLLYKNWDVIKAKAGELWAKTTEVFGGMASWISTKWDEMKTSAIEKFTALVTGATTWFETLKTTIVEKVSSAITTAVTFIADLPNKLAYWLGYGVATATLWLSQLPGKFAEFFSASYNNAVTWISQVPGRIGSFLSTTYNNAVAKLQSIATSFGTWFKSAYDKAIEWVSKVPGKIASFLAEIPGKVSKAIGEVVKAFTDLGKAIPKAIEDGFTAGINALGKGGAWIMGKLLDGVTDLFSLGKEAAGSYNAGVEAAGGVKSGGGKSKKGKGHYHGLKYVPYDGYSATLHRGERVVTRQENKALANGELGGGSVTFNLYGTTVREEADIDKIADKLVVKIKQAREAGA